MDVYDKIMLDEYQRGQKMNGQITPLVCPEMRGEKCRLCELTHEVFKHEKRKDSPLREKASQYNQKKKYYSNIIFPALNPAEIKLFEYGEKIFRKLLNAQMDALSEYKNFFDHIVGRNLYIIKQPAPVKRNTNYDVEFRIQTTPIPEITLALIHQQKLYKLDKVIEYMAQGITPMRQGDLNDGRNEVRILPSWLGQKSSMFFFVMKYHFISKDEFDAIQTGRLNPFKDEIVIRQDFPGAVQNPMPWMTQDYTPKAQESTIYPKKETLDRGPEKLCFGTFEEGSPLCNTKCDVTEICKTHTAEKKQARETASKLYPK